MKRFVVVALSALLFVPSLVFAASAADGVWTGAIDASHAQPIEFHLTTVDSKLTGSIIIAPTELSIQDGTFVGASLTFTTVPAGDTSRPKTTWVGTLSGDTITFSRVVDGDNVAQEFTVTRKP